MIRQILEALDEQTIAREVGLPHDDARLSFSLPGPRVGSFTEYIDLIGRYYDYHFSTCIVNGGHLDRSDAQQRAREVIEQAYRREDGDIVMAYNDAVAGTNGGVRRQIDVIADQLREEATRRYVQGVFDRHIAPNEWSEKVEIIREFLREMSHILGNAVDSAAPERYARDYQTLIHAFAKGVDGPRRSARRF